MHSRRRRKRLDHRPLLRHDGLCDDDGNISCRTGSVLLWSTFFHDGDVLLFVCLFVSLLPMRSCQLLAHWRSSVLVLVPMTGCIIAALPTAPVFVCGPLTSTWPYLRCDVGLEAGEY